MARGICQQGRVFRLSVIPCFGCFSGGCHAVGSVACCKDFTPTLTLPLKGEGIIERGGEGSGTVAIGCGGCNNFGHVWIA